MGHLQIRKVLNLSPNSQKVIVKGWVKTFRANRFISLNDGSCLENIQCVVDFENMRFRKFFPHQYSTSPSSRRSRPRP